MSGCGLFVKWLRLLAVTSYTCIQITATSKLTVCISSESHAAVHSKVGAAEKIPCCSACKSSLRLLQESGRRSRTSQPRSHHANPATRRSETVRSQKTLVNWHCSFTKTAGSTANLERDTLGVALVVGPMNLLVLVIPAGVHHPAGCAHVEEEVGLPQIQVELP
jgi:hypothetical protein